ncbi:hypothetical protein ACVWW6_000609 [Bradyrhizobium sp. USDA 3311]
MGKLDHKVFQRAVLFLKKFHRHFHSIFVVKNLGSAFVELHQPWIEKIA